MGLGVRVPRDGLEQVPWPSLTLFRGNGIGLLLLLQLLLRFSSVESWEGASVLEIIVLGPAVVLKFITDSDPIPGNTICFDNSSKLADQFFSFIARLLARVESVLLILQEAVDEEDSRGFFVTVGVIIGTEEGLMYLFVLLGEEEEDEDVSVDGLIDLSLLFSIVSNSGALGIGVGVCGKV